MKSILSGLTVITIFSLSSCGGSSTKGNMATGDSAKGNASQTAAPANTTVSSAPTMTVNEADWEIKDLSTVAPFIHISMKVPKNAKMEKNGNGGVDIRVNDFYLMTVSAPAVSTAKEALDDIKGLTINGMSYMNGKALTEEPNGMVYTEQMKTEANGNTYQPEVHFAYVICKPDGAFYTVMDVRPLDNFSVAGSAYSADIANKVYAIVKGSAKENN
jgi:hypothetical protein